jgi:hypothetical protein
LTEKNIRNKTPKRTTDQPAGLCKIGTGESECVGNGIRSVTSHRGQDEKEEREDVGGDVERDPRERSGWDGRWYTRV